MQTTTLDVGQLVSAVPTLLAGSVTMHLHQRCDLTRPHLLQLLALAQCALDYYLHFARATADMLVRLTHVCVPCCIRASAAAAGAGAYAL